jgi:ABC-2 type transport system ATP-binding protein
MAEMTAAISIQNLSFRYAGQAKDCLSDINLEIAQGESFGLFGPNGAGKTTLMSLMTGLISFSKGSVLLLGTPVLHHKKSLNSLFGFVPQDFSLYQELSPVENLEYFGALSGLNRNRIDERTNELLEVLNLTHVRDKQVHTFSGGMKRLVNLAIGVIHEPSILFLDEPTVGVDVETRQKIIQYLQKINERGTTLVYTSHQLSEAEELCKKVALIDLGKIVAHDRLEVLLETHQLKDLEGLFVKLTGKQYKDH